MAWHTPKPRETITDWRFDHLFGVPVLVGFGQDGRRICQHVWWWSNDCFGTETTVFRQGRRAFRTFPAEGV